MPWLLVAGSAAIDTVDDGTCPPPFTDQRGIKRLQDGNGGVGPACDTGSYKLIGGPQSPPPTTATCHGLTATNAGTAAGEMPMGAAGRPAIQYLAGNDVNRKSTSQRRALRRYGRRYDLRWSGQSLAQFNEQGNDHLVGVDGIYLLDGGIELDLLDGRTGQGGCNGRPPATGDRD